jgi:acyl-coenzyme A synthetase/AMP-(fatty) acid ligase
MVSTRGVFHDGRGGSAAGSGRRKDGAEGICCFRTPRGRFPVFHWKFVPRWRDGWLGRDALIRRGSGIVIVLGRLDDSVGVLGKENGLTPYRRSFTTAS